MAFKIKIQTIPCVRGMMRKMAENVLENTINDWENKARLWIDSKQMIIFLEVDASCHKLKFKSMEGLY